MARIPHGTAYPASIAGYTRYASQEPHMRKLLFTAALLLCSHITHAVELTVLTGKGYVRFTVPDEWQVLVALPNDG